MKKKYGEGYSDFFRKIGRVGGQRSVNGGFASTKVGKDGLTGPERARICGYKGGRISRRGPAKKVEDGRDSEDA